MKFFIRIALIFIAFSISIKPSKAAHASAMELYYYWVSGSTYNFTLTFYRVCNSSGAPANFSIQGSSVSTSGSVSATLSQLPTSGTGVPPLIPDNFLNCAPSSSLCFEEYVYRGNMTLPVQARDWEFTSSLCCVPFDVDNINTSGVIMVKAGLNNLDFPDTLAKNISPVWHTRRPNIPVATGDTFINFPILSFCEYRNYVIDQHAKEYQNDRVKYEFTVPNGGFVSPYSFLDPLPQDSPPAFTIDSNLAKIVYKPIPPIGTFGATKLYLLNIKATEYRMDTDLVGGSYVQVEKIIGYTIRNLFITTTDSSSCPDLNISFSDSSSLSTATNSIDLTCDNNPIEIGFTDNVLCNSIDSNASNIILLNAATMDTIHLVRSLPYGCTTYNSTNSFGLYLDSALTGGTYYLMFKTGDDSNTVVTECGLELEAFADTLTLNVTAAPGLGEIMGDTLIGSRDTLQVECNGTKFTIDLSEKAKCSSVDGNGGDFTLVDNSGSSPVFIPITKAQPICANGNTKKVKLTLGSVLQPGFYTLSLKNGPDSNSFIDACFHNWDSSSIIIRVDKIEFHFGPDIEYCKNEDFDTTLNAGSNYAAYLWNNNSLGNSINIDTAGKYWVQVTDLNGCKASDTLNVTEKDCFTGITSFEMANILVFPNPASDKLNVSVPPKFIGSVLNMYNLEGKLMKFKNLESEKSTVDLYDLNHGSYILEVKNSSGQIFQKQIVVE